MRAPSFSASFRSKSHFFTLIGALGVVLGCGSEASQNDDVLGTDGTSGGAGGSPPSSQAVAEALLPEAPVLHTIYTPRARRSATALAFNPGVEDELWAVLRQFPVDDPCTSTDTTGCSALIGEVAIISAASSEEPSTQVKRDDNAWHFMRRPTSIAFGDNGNLATCSEARTGNFEDEAADFNGPTLWSSDPAIFGVEPEPGQNGRHIDMLHSTPFCMGIAHEAGNAYWAFNGNVGALDRYDFHEPHEIGGEDHSDGELHRYVEGELLRVPEVPSHLVLDRETALLYVADTGHGRIARLDITSGFPIGEATPNYDRLHVHEQMGGATLVDVVPPGTVERPSGITLHRGVLLVTDNATSTVHAFDRNGAPLRSLQTGLPAGSLAGIAVGPDGKVYLTDLLTGAVYRLDVP